MIHKISYQNSLLRFRDTGEGYPVILLHGYLESLEIWDSLVPQLSEHFRLIIPDLPGHGESWINDSASIADMADAVNFIMNFLGINKCVMIGHSMGGYATLAFLDYYLEKLGGFCLFHSTPFADTDEKIENRNREIELINEGKKKLLVSTNIPKAFADDNHDTFREYIENAKKIALRTTDSGIIYALEAMMGRHDYSELLEKTKLPFLLVLGKKDNYIPYEFAKDNIPRPEDNRKLYLSESGHMGFIEEKEKSVEAIIDFVNHCKNVTQN